MSRKLPIAETAVDGIMFAIRNTLPTLRVGWLPILIWGALTGAGLWIILTGIPGFEDGFIDLRDRIEAAEASGAAMDEVDWEYVLVAEGDIAPGRVLGGAGLALLATLIFVPLMTLLFQVAAGDRRMPDGFFYWRWGGPEARLVATLIIYLVVIGGISFALETVGLLLVDAADDPGNLVFGWATTVVPIVVFVLTMWVTLRTTLVLPAAAIENRLNFLEAVGATGGNVFRILGSLILVGLMMIAVFFAYLIALLILVMLTGAIAIMLGTETAAGQVFDIITSAVFFVVTIVAYLGAQLVGFGWAGRAWAALRQG